MIRTLLFTIALLMTGSVNPGIAPEVALLDKQAAPASDAALPARSLPHVMALNY